ncbi:hypothetical protein GIB67_016578 [Kingdonia uniflora]|uniref:Translation elongation factor EFTs/EF1B dimerisation domain-containing protein n=1 Tax=Kingdonia uniflora TaxID=39325 RepID=A0A7J7MZF8_9MAGN|nr:hypothetical protein GIB67_016578 [Kingdonia uniflora]
MKRSLSRVNCETDFVGRIEKFKELVNDLALKMQREDLQSKPENIRGKIIEGQISKRLEELALLEQPFIRNDSILIHWLKTPSKLHNPYSILFSKRLALCPLLYKDLDKVSAARWRCIHSNDYLNWGCHLGLLQYENHLEPHRGDKVHLYGAGTSLAVSENDGGVPVTLEFGIQTRGNVMPETAKYTTLVAKNAKQVAADISKVLQVEIEA